MKCQDLIFWLVTAMVLGCETALGVPVKSAPSFLEVGSCANSALMENFQVQKYLGNWYPVWNEPSSYVSSQKCIVDKVTLSGRKMKVVTDGLTTEGEPAKSHAKLKLIKPQNKNKKAYMELEAPLVPPVPYYILSTDYTTYSCVYACYSLFGLKAELLWSYARDPEAASGVQDKCLEIFQEKELDVSRMSKVDHEGCGHEVPPLPVAVFDVEVDGGDGIGEAEEILQNDSEGVKQNIQDETKLENVDSMINNDDEDDSEGSGGGLAEGANGDHSNHHSSHTSSNRNHHNHNHHHGHTHNHNHDHRNQHNHNLGHNHQHNHDHQQMNGTNNESITILKEVTALEDVLVDSVQKEAEELERSANQLVLDMAEVVEAALANDPVEVKRMEANNILDAKTTFQEASKVDSEVHHNTASSISTSNALKIVISLSVFYLHKQNLFYFR